MKRFFLATFVIYMILLLIGSISLARTFTEIAEKPNIILGISTFVGGSFIGMILLGIYAVLKKQEESEDKYTFFLKLGFEPHTTKAV